MKSPLTIGYNDLIKEQERILAQMEASYPLLVSSGQIASFTARKRIECAKTLIRLLRKHKREPQGDLFQMMEKLK
jgi:hypothetical protein